ncbi:hypothetical protein Scep_017285 [Stephania cephalantha]|uniref:NAC domain-containing protein n=1 Tax=Stephania cephalantha TaxID=152367 RepID=A0AAP0IR44_9MAGN
MENISGFGKFEEDQMDLPPGFRFHPTDEELITHYLSKKVSDGNFNARAIGEVDLNKCEPWELPWRAKMGEKEWYFFCVRDRKYPTGLRTNRATEAGYWKATGKDKEIFRAKTLVGMKKTLVFYKGRAPKGEKTNWVMHEYRLEGKLSFFNLPKTAKNEWVLCRIFQKSSGGKKTYVSGLVRLSSIGEDLGHNNNNNSASSSLLPPLMDSSPYSTSTKTKSGAAETAHVTCFSNSMESQKDQDDNNITDSNCFNSPLFSAPPPPNNNNNNNNNSVSASSSMIFAKFNLPNSIYSTQTTQNMSNFQYPCSGLMPDQSILRALLDGSVSKQSCKTEREIGMSMSQETGLTTTDINTEISSVVSNHEMGRRVFRDQHHNNSDCPVDLDWWNY